MISYDVFHPSALQKDPGMIVLIGGDKGGTGKTTVATNLAALRAAAGMDVLLVDTDRQGTAAAWCQLRADHAALSPVPCVQLFGKTVQTGIRDLAGRYREILIDAGGRDAVELRSALVVADCVYIPIQPSQYDLWTLEHMQELVVAAQGFNPTLAAFVLLTRVSTHPLVADTADARQALEGLEPLQLARPMLAERQAWRRSARTGQAVTELARPDPKAATELRLLYGAIYHD
jgi:chromosome partitioning protein